MRLRGCSALAGALACTFLLSPVLIARDKSTLPQAVVTARYVCISSFYGADPVNARIPPDDRAAMADVEQAFRKWGHYIVTVHPEDADLIVVVRRGKVGNVKIGDRIGIGSLGTYNVPVADAEVGSPEDMLAVHLRSNGGVDSPALWRQSEKGGLDEPALSLFQKFKRDVEDASKTKP